MALSASSDYLRGKPISGKWAVFLGGDARQHPRNSMTISINNDDLAGRIGMTVESPPLNDNFAAPASAEQLDLVEVKGASPRASARLDDLE